MIKTNYHNHTKLCRHAEGMPIDYIKRAIVLGYEEIGMSEHAPLHGEWKYRMSMDEFYNEYLENINKAKKLYSDKIKIYSGLEIEYHPSYKDHYETLLKDLDYLILGQHFVDINGILHDVFKELDDEKIISYKDLIIEGMKTGYFRILAHPDLYLYKYVKWNQLAEKIAREIIEASIKYNVIIEINANGIRRKQIYNQDNQLVYTYPRIEFWNIVKEYKDAKIIIGEDNHKIEYMSDDSVKRAYKFAKDLGLKPITYLFEE